MNKIPQKFQSILWSANIKDLDLEKDKNYIIHQILMYGDLNQIKWLIGIYGLTTVREVFIKSPQVIYSPEALNFIKNIVLGLGKIKIKEEKYVKTLF